jgi:uncharacterized protein YcfJ
LRPMKVFGMRIWITTLVAVCAMNSANAQLLHPEAVQYSMLGAFLGGVVGAENHCGHYHWSGEGAAIGAGIGLVAGTLVGEANRQQYNAAYAYPAPPVYGYAPTQVAPVPSAPVVYTPAPPPAPPRPNYVVSGTLVGATAGALIGEGASHNPGQGAAIGAATGLLVGGIAEHNARKREAASHPPPASPALASQPASSNKPPSSPAPNHQLSGPTHQIPDAPLVPDAPTF